MREYVVYQFDRVTGFITGTNHATRKDSDPFLTLPGHHALTGYITSTMLTEHPDRPHEKHHVSVSGGGWSFAIDSSGNPAFDEHGNHILIPPPFIIAPPSVHDYAILGHIKSGALDPLKDIHPNYVTGLNRALKAHGLPTIPGIEPVPHPTRSCITNSAGLKPKG